MPIPNPSLVEVLLGGGDFERDHLVDPERKVSNTFSVGFTLRTGHAAGGSAT